MLSASILLLLFLDVQANTVPEACEADVMLQARVSHAAGRVEEELDAGVANEDAAASASATEGKGGQKPHILWIVADDIGYNDVGFRQNKPSPVNPAGLPTRGEAVKTPNIDRLVSESVLLQKYYTQSTCTPSRAALLTGRYPYRTGMGPYPIPQGMPYGIPGSETFIGEVLSDAGYATHMVGKWHLGMGDRRWTPTFRGFESFQGFLSGSVDYRTHEKQGALDFINTSLNSKNIFANNTNAFSGRYTVDVFPERVAQIVDNHVRTDASRPLFLYIALQNNHASYADFDAAPEKFFQMYTGDGENGRRTQMADAMTTAMDDAIGNIEDIFKQSEIWDDTILVFTSDNGGNPLCAGGQYHFCGKDVWPGGGNYPLRGYKSNDWEGGIRGLAFVRGSAVWPLEPGETNELIHITDFFPTMAHVAGASVDSLKLDGNNIWSVLSSGASTPRTSIIQDCPWKGRMQSAIQAARQPGRAGAIRKGSLKFMVANEGPLSVTSENGQIRQLGFTDDSLMCPPAAPIDGLYLFDIDADPRECTNLAGDDNYKADLTAFQDLLEACSEEAVPNPNMFFWKKGTEYTEANMKHTKVWDEELQMKIWTEWDCGAKYPGKCGWPMR